MRISLRFLVALTFAAIGPLNTERMCAVGQVIIRPAALTDTDGPLGPGLGPGVTFNAFGIRPSVGFPPGTRASAVINGSGQTAFFATLAGPGVDNTNDTGIWIAGSEGVDLVAREGDPAPGTEEDTHFRKVITKLVMNDLGQVAFLGHLAGPNVTGRNDIGIWVGTPGSLSLVAREGHPAPGTVPPADFKKLIEFPSRSQKTNIALNNRGEIAFAARTQSTGGKGIWVGVPDALSMIDKFSSFPRLNDLGQVAFVEDSSDTIWAGFPQQLSPIVQVGDPTGLNSVFRNFFHNRIGFGGDGQVAFVATTIDSAGGIGIGTWTADQNAIMLLMDPAVPPPGLEPDGSFVFIIIPSNITFPIMNAVSDVAFLSLAQTPDEPLLRGIWRVRSGSMSLVALTERPAPGTPAGTLFSSLSEPIMNGSSKLAFQASLKHAGGASFDRGIWIQDDFDRLRLVVRTGQEIDLGDGNVWPVDHFVLNVNQGASIDTQRGDPLNDAGQIVFAAELIGGISGIFVAQLASPGDVDGDQDVDTLDFTVFASCFNRAGRAPRSVGCSPAQGDAFDFDGDHDVDLADFGVFAACFNRSGHPPRTAGCP